MTARLVRVSAAQTIQAALTLVNVVPNPLDVLCYEVQKKEDVSAAKEVALLMDRNSKPIVGEEARVKVGLPKTGKGVVQPADVPSGSKLFVQSTSLTRMMKPGSSVLVLQKGPQLTATKAQSAAKSTSTGANDKRKSMVPPEGETQTKKSKHDSAQPVKAKPWASIDTIYIRDYQSPSSTKVAGFDMDSTLIRTKSGKTFPTSKDDWVWWAPEVVPKLQALHKVGFKVVIITNQGGVAKGKTKIVDIQSKIDAIQGQAGIPLLAIVLTDDDTYRKPLPGSWKILESRFNGGVAISKNKSMYCGDAAGRLPPVVSKKDFSANDLKFALNVGVPFETPEECFLGKPQKYERNKFDFDPRSLGVSPTKIPIPPFKSQTLIIIVGPPGSGKSALATQHFKTCTRVNQDTLKTKEKCLSACADALKAGKSVVVDNQNKSKVDRAPYLKLAHEISAAAVAVSYDVPKELCFHLNAYRMLNKCSKLHRAEKVPSMVIHSFYKNVEKPTESEGFGKVFRVGMEHFTINTDDADVKLLRSFLD